MPTAVALRFCPHAVVVKPRGGRYRELSDRVFGIYDDFTPLVQPLSIDEAFLDVGGSTQLLGPAPDLAARIKARVKAETGLTVSVGVAPNKFLAKLASDLEKPDGLTIIEPGRVHEVLDPLPVTRLWGVGPAAEKALAKLGLRTIGDIRKYPEAVLVSKLGSFGTHLAALSRGDDDRPVTPDREAKTIGHEQTFGENLTDPDEVRAVMLAQAEAVARRARKHARSFGGVTVKIRFGNFQTVTRSVMLDGPTDTTDALAQASRELFDAWCKEPAGFRSVRLIGVTATHLSDASAAGAQPGLFDDDTERTEAKRSLDKATDAITERYGKGSIRRAGSYAPNKRVGFDHSAPDEETELEE